MLKTNKERLIETAVEGVVQPASGRGFSVWGSEFRTRVSKRRRMEVKCCPLP